MLAETRLGVTLRAAGLTDRGRRREHNEDVALVRTDLALYVVADGAGGHNAGDVAARLAAHSLANYFESTQAEAGSVPDVDQFGFPAGARRLSAAIHKANRDVVEISKSSQQHRGMGTTVVAAHFSDAANVLHVAHVGDSRCYRYRAPHLELLTQDHSLLIDVLEQRPELDDAVLARLPKHVVTRALGMDPHLRVSLSSHQVTPGDRFLLCSDGLSSPATAQEIAAILAVKEAPDVIAGHLIQLANTLGGPDNIAALVIDCTESGSPGTSVAPEAERSSEELDEDPEILILGIEELNPDERPDTASDGLLKTLGELIKRGK